MPTGDFWDITTNPKKPTGEFDKDAVLDIPWDWSDWLAEIGSSIPDDGVHVTMTPTSPMEVVSTHVLSAGTKVVARIKVGSAYVPANLNKTYPVVCHIKAADGQEEDQTLWFKIVEH